MNEKKVYWDERYIHIIEDGGIPIRFSRPNPILYYYYDNDLYLDSETTGLNVFNDKVIGVGVRFKEENHWFDDFDELLKFLIDNNKLIGRIITYNGGHFDLPIIFNNIDDNDIRDKLRKLITDKHLDLYHQFGAYNEHMKRKRKSKVFLFEKYKVPYYNKISGVEVPELFKEGRLDEIIEYNFRELEGMEELMKRASTNFFNKPPKK